MSQSKGTVKIKSNSSAKKRFRITKNGQYKHRAAYKNHILTKKNSKRKRQLRTPAGFVSQQDKKMVARACARQ